MVKMYLIVCSCLLSLSVMAQKANSSVQVKIEKGIIEGIKAPNKGLSLYFGIPFAKPPVGEFRWKAPQPLDCWDGILETKKFGAKPVQMNVYGDMKSRSERMSEDCLYLNVWTPAKKEDAKELPVLVYFYGGGFLAGDGSEPRYDGASMAQKGIVVVTVNYRLNIFGFFAYPELSAETEYKASGNYGLLDQNEALKWVQRNISAFGGDPKKVTIAGESAGSISVSAQMASPLSKKLIAGAIGESGAAINPTLFPIPLAEAEQKGVGFAKKAGLTSLSELRKLSTSELFEIYKQSGNYRFPTVIDGYFYPKSLPDIFNAKEQAQVPLLLGWNSAEIPGMAFMQGLPYTKENFIKKVKSTYPDSYDEVLELYSHDTEKEIEQSATDLASDRFISYSTWKWFDLHRKNSSQQVYRYLFSRIRPALVDQDVVSGLAGGTQKKEDDSFKIPEPIGAAHASEIEYCMGNLYLVNDYAWTDDDYAVSENMLAYFANFIQTGNPNGDGLEKWPAAEAMDVAPPVMQIDVESKVFDAKNDNRYLFLDRDYKNNQ